MRRRNRVYLEAKERIKEEHLLAIPFDRLKEIDVLEGKRFFRSPSFPAHAELQINVVKGVFEDKIGQTETGR